MTSSVSKVERSLHFVHDRDNFSPQLHRKKFFNEGKGSSHSASDDDDSRHSSGTNIQDSVYGIDHRYQKKNSKRDFRKLLKKKSRMFVKGATNTFNSDDEFLDSEKDLHRSESSSSKEQLDKTNKSLSLRVQNITIPFLKRFQTQQTQDILINSSQGSLDAVPEMKELVLRMKSNLIFFWNLVILVSILVDLVLIPFEVSLQDVEYFGSFSFTVIIIIQVIYIADIFISFHKSYHDEQVREVTDLQSIRLRYFESYNFCIDIFACVPMLAFNKIFYYRKGYNQLFLLVRTVKALKVKNLIVEFHQKFYISAKLYFLGYLVSVLMIVSC